jgi:ubiquinone/menaquinone biosynthesis C-methylase UbiE
MRRQLEHELISDPLHAQAYARGDFSEAHGRFVPLFRKAFPDFNGKGWVLDLGCGTGDITLRFAQAFHGCKINGVDGSDAMLELARKVLASDPAISGHITLTKGVLPDMFLPREKYDCIISNSLLHHLHNPQILWKSILQYGSSGAPVFIVDLKRPATSAAAQRIVETYASQEDPVLKRDFFHSLLAAFEPEEIRTQLFRAGLGHFKVTEVSDRHVAVSGYLP